MVSTLPQLSAKRHRLVVVRQVTVTPVQSNPWRVPNEFEHKKKPVPYTSKYIRHVQNVPNFFPTATR